MIQLSKKIFVIILLCLTIAGCGDQEKINSLRDQLSECQATSQKTYTAWETKKQNLDACLTAKNNLYNFVDDKGTYLDKTAKLFNIYPWQSIVVGLVLLVFLSGGCFIGTGFLLKWRDSTERKESEKIIKSAKQARQAILEASEKLSHTQEQVNALEAQKTMLITEIQSLKKINNLDANREKKLIIDNAISEANLIIDEARDQATRIFDEVNELKAQLKIETEHLEKIRKSMIESY